MSTSYTIMQTICYPKCLIILRHRDQEIFYVYGSKPWAHFNN